jgi:hypothetical protein
MVAPPRSVLRATLHHLCPDAPSTASPAACTTLTVEQQLAFPRGFSSWGPEADVDPSAARKMGLSAKEVHFFKEQGFIVRRWPSILIAQVCTTGANNVRRVCTAQVKRGLIPKEHLVPWVDRMWDVAIPPCVDRNDRSTWTDPGRLEGWGPSKEFVAKSERVGRVNRGYPADYGPSSIRWAEIGSEPGYVDATTAHPNVLRMVQAFLGGPIKRPHRTRGQYIHFPTHKQAEPPLYGLGPHSDTQPGELFGFVYLDDVPPRSGGTCIWPTSPQRLYSCLDHEQSYGFHPNSSFGPTFRKTVEEVPPVEFVGSAGDVIFL